MKLLVWNKYIKGRDGNPQAVAYDIVTSWSCPPYDRFLFISHSGGRTMIPLEAVAQYQEQLEPGDVKPADAKAH